MTLPFAGLARARARMLGGRLEGEAEKFARDQQEAGRLFREWATRRQLDDAAAERKAAREWQEQAFSAGQEERAQARADQSAWRQEQAQQQAADREAQRAENARLQRERLDAQREQATQQDQTRRMIAAMAQSRQHDPRRNDTRDDRNVNQLSQRFQANPVVKDAYGVANALGTIKAGLANESPMADLQTMYAVVKLFDPGSVVREGEIKLTRSANSLPGRARLLWQNWTKGKILTPEMRQQIAGLVDEQMGQYETRVAPIQAEYGKQARARGVESDSSFIAPSPFDGVRAIKGPTPRGRPPIESLLRSR